MASSSLPPPVDGWWLVVVGGWLVVVGWLVVGWLLMNLNEILSIDSQNQFGSSPSKGQHDCEHRTNQKFT